MQHKFLSGPTNFDSPWNPLYLECQESDPLCVDEAREFIAIHGAGHALVQIAHGVSGMNLRMPSFADTPHVASVVPHTHRLPHPIPRSGNVIEDSINRVCYLIAGPCAQHLQDDGSYHYISCTADVIDASTLCDEIASVLKVDSNRIYIKAIASVDHLLLKHWALIDAISTRLTEVGFIDSAYLKRLCKPVERRSTALHVLSKLNDDLTDEEIKRSDHMGSFF